MPLKQRNQAKTNYFDIPAALQVQQGSVGKVVANVPEVDIIANQFEIQSYYDVQVWTNDLEKDINSLVSLTLS